MPKEITRCYGSKAGKSLEHTNTVVWKEERASLVKNKLTLNLTITECHLLTHLKSLPTNRPTSTDHGFFEQSAVKDE